MDSIDITRLPEEKLLDHLGTGNWHIALPNDRADIIFTRQMREALYEIAGIRFAWWVISGVRYTLDHGHDPPWDSSGYVYSKQADPMLLLTQYETLQDWANDEYTGNSHATFVSGMGRYWETFADEIADEIEQELYKKFVAYYEVELDDIVEDIILTVIFLQFAIQTEALQMTSSEAWKRYEGTVRGEIEAQRKAAEIFTKKCQIVDQFWWQYFPQLMERRIEMPEFRLLNLEQEIVAVLADTDPEIVRMIVEIGAPFQHSNRVCEIIVEVARRAIAR